MPSLLLLGLGFLVGTFGTLIGAGGGFVLVPVLLMVYPSERPEGVTAISLAVVFFNAFSGSIAYARRRRIDYRSGIAFAIAAVPGTVLGVLATHHVPRDVYQPIFGAALVAISLYLLVRKTPDLVSPRANASTIRTLVDSEGREHSWAFHAPTGIGLSVIVGLISSFLGIGGGIIHVPALVHLLNFPVHIATATSHFVLAIMAGIATLQHGLDGSLAPGFGRLLFLAPGVVLGAQVGAHFSERVRGAWILRLLALALLAVGIRLVI